MSSKIKVDIPGYYKTKKQLERMKTAPQRALASAEVDLKDRVPKWIAAGVADRYNLDGGKDKSKAAVSSGKVGKLRIKGGLINDTLRFEYSGRSLTPTHFGMKPTVKPPFGSEYTLKWKVLRAGKETKAKIKKLTKKQRKNIGRNFTHQSTQNSPRSPWMLQPTGANSADKTQYIPFQRRGQTDPFRYAARGPALPQMIKEKGKKLRPEVAKHFNKNLETRVNAAINRVMPKK